MCSPIPDWPMQGSLAALEGCLGHAAGWQGSGVDQRDLAGQAIPTGRLGEDQRSCLGDEGPHRSRPPMGVPDTYDTDPWTALRRNLYPGRWYRRWKDRLSPAASCIRAA